MLGAYAIQESGLERKASEAIESKIGWTSDPDVVRASEALGNNQLDEAAAILRKHLSEKPASLDALTLQQQVHWRRNDTPAYLQTTIALCQFHLKAQEFEPAWQAFEEYTNGGGTALPAATWLELARKFEGQENFHRAVSEYARLAEAHPVSKESLMALLSAGRLSLKKLNQPAESLRYYKAAQVSPVPHLDWEPNIRAGIQDAEKALSSTIASVLK